MRGVSAGERGREEKVVMEVCSSVVLFGPGQRRTKVRGARRVLRKGGCRVDGRGRRCVEGSRTNNANVTMYITGGV